jgi:hypothetical protein
VVNVEKAVFGVLRDNGVLVHECFWADEHVHTARGLGVYRRAKTCAHGFSVRFDEYVNSFGEKPKRETMPIYQKKSKPQKPRIPHLLFLILLSMLALPAFSQTAPKAVGVKKGAVALGVGYATVGTLGDFKTVRDSGYSGSFEYWFQDQGSFLAEAEKLKSGNIYEASYARKAGSLFIPIGVSRFEPAGLDSTWGAHVGVGLNLWAEKILGIQLQGTYTYLLDQIAGEDQFISGKGVLRLRF